MQVVMSKKKYIILLFVMLILAATTAAIYLFANPNKNKSNSYQVDKYSDVTSWCDTNQDDEKLAIDCKALLINIDANSCFEVQVITRDNELKNLTVCEKNDTLTYSNDILGYKKLMPINMIFTYTKEGMIGNYSFGSVSFNKIDDTYIQNIVNEDIANLVTIDPSTTTIQNSVDFCPRPESLPSYVTEANKLSYSEFYTKNLMPKEQYDNSSLYDWQNEDNIKLLYASNSQITAGYSTSHPLVEIDSSDALIEALSQNPIPPQFENLIDNVDSLYLKQISALYDNSSMISSQYKNNYLFHIVEALNTNSRSEEMFCGTYNLLELASITNPTLINQYLNKMYDIISNNIPKLHSITCANILTPEEINFTGKYMKFSIDSNIMYRCINLNSFLGNK